MKFYFVIIEKRCIFAAESWGRTLVWKTGGLFALNGVQINIIKTLIMDMKKIKRTAWLLLAVCMAAVPTLHGQTFFDFVYGSIGNNTSHSIIRSYNATEAVVYYEDGTDHFLALVGLTGMVYGARLNPLFTVNDIRVVGDEAYFCGRHGGRGFVGRADINSLRSLSPNVQYYDLDADKVSGLTRMVAYQFGGMTKVVAVGSYCYTHNDPTGTIFPPCPPNHICRASIVVECDFSGSTPPYSRMLVVNSQTRIELAFDIVETDHYVAVVTHYTDWGQTAIHRCDKANVLATFPLGHGYPSPYFRDMTGYMACKTGGDTIAVAGMALIADDAPYATVLRTFDLQSMAMTSFQGYGISDKSVPSELVYMPRYATLVMQQLQPFPSTAYSSPFVYWEPYEASAYYAKVMLEASHRKHYGSLDRLTEKHYVSTGGDYWIMKDVSFDNTPNRCYKIDSLKINIYPIEPPTSFSPPYHTAILYADPTSGATGVRDTINEICIP